ncbi:hypothetical protein BCR42DRAFT_426619 [Absidia repens]|uniref:Uncharacterized protein n=1 Tax=Absidia repens TaxID=90262 RepID=A0A1X2I0N3_9FUNG|nr:hypothetical protein BCR42DRAFT_426619 [Absidia repens]
MANNGDNGNNSFLAMLNNPVINPPKQQGSSQQQPSTTHIAQSSAPLFPAAQHCQDKLQACTKDLYLISETDAPWQNVLMPWSSNELPDGRQALDDAGLLVRNTHIDQFEADGDEENDFKVETLGTFFDRLMKDNDNNKAQADQYTILLEQIKQLLGDNVNVYLVGSRVVTVLILGLVQDSGMKALVGLQSELVET